MGNIISFSGLASGMDTSSWIEALVAIKQKSVTALQTKKNNVSATQNNVDSIKAKVSSLRSAVEAFTDAKFGGSFDLFSKNKVSSSNESVVTASATGEAARQSFDVVVKELATSTKAVSSIGSLGNISNDTLFKNLASGNAVTGDLSIYVNGSKNTINISDTSTLGDIISQINSIDGINASITDGKLSVTAEDGNSIVVGSSSDKTNFTSVLGLVRDDDGNYSSNNTISSINTSSTFDEIFANSDIPFQGGTLTIGNAEFSVSGDTTLKSFINSINSNEDAHTTAYWDSVNGELVLTAKNEGAFNINIEAGTSNLSHLMGLTKGVLDGEGNYTTDENGKLVSSLANQSLGQYAKLTINGNDITSSSNTVTSDISGITGLTLTLNAVSKPDEEGSITPATINIEQNQESLVSAVKTFISAFNSTISTIDNNTKFGSKLYGDTGLTTLRNSIRQTTTSSIASDSIKLLSDIGITTGNANTSTDTSGVNTLQLDEEKFKEALSKNPEGVRKLLIGDGKGTETSGGIMNSLETLVEGSLDSTTGYFAVKTKSNKSTTSSLDSQIERAQQKVDNYKTRLQKQFSNMEKLISTMKANFSNFAVV